MAESEQLDYKRLKVWENSSLMMERERASSESDEEDEPPSGKGDDPHLMDAEERHEWRRKIREVIDRTPDVEEEVDLVEKRLPTCCGRG